MLRACLTVAVSLAVAACGTNTTGDDDRGDDACDTTLAGSAGAVEVGKGGAGDFSPLANGDPFQVVLGPQGLWMFVLGARVDGMDITDGGTGAAWFSAVGPAGEAMSLEFGCSERNFEAAADGGIEMSTGFPLAIFPDYSAILAGGNVTLKVTVRDRSGHEAVGETTIVSSMPM
jgi:hypothetical protein